MEKIWSNSKSIKWDEKNILGQGCQGTVVFSGHFDGQPVAVKRILLTNTQLVKRELDALVECSGHQHILQLYHVEYDAQFLRLALELCVATLDDYCKGKYIGAIPTETEAMKQMLEGLSFIHSRKYVHRDVKPNNILIAQSGDIKIADFGVCKPVKGIGSFSLSVAGVGTEGWMAPELLKSITEVEQGGKAAPNATTAIDVFPLGCVFYFFLTKGTHPFGTNLFRNANIIQGKYDLSKLKKKNIIYGLIKEMISADPKQRPKLDEVLTRPIFNVTTSTSEELLKDDTKFSIWLKDIKKQFSRNKNKESPRLRSKTVTDECDSPTYNAPKYHHDTFTTPTSFSRTPLSRGLNNNLQVVDEEHNIGFESEGLMFIPRPKAYSESVVKRRSGVSSAPQSWQNTMPRRKVDRVFFLSEYYADGAEDDSDSTGSPHLRSVISMTNIDHKLDSSVDSLSTLSLASSTITKSASMLSLTRTFVGELFNKST